MKPSYEKLKVIMVYAIKHEKQNNMFTGKSNIAAVPTGEVHLCELTIEKDGPEASRFMLCGKSRSDIGEQTKDSDKRPNHLSMCPKCEIKWKMHPDSPWKAWEGKTNDRTRRPKSPSRPSL